MEEKNEGFAQRIRAGRKEKGLSQKELGVLAGVSNKAVSKWETGEALPQMKTVIRLAEIFDTDTETLLSGTRIAPVPAPKAAIPAALQTENAQLRSALGYSNQEKRRLIFFAQF